VRINVGARIRAERKARNLSQADLERRTGLPRCRISYLENGRAVPTIETLEKLSDALEVPLCQLFYDGLQPAQGSTAPRANGLNGHRRHTLNRTGQVLRQLRQHLSKMGEDDQELLLFIARKIASRGPARFSALRQSVRRDSSKGKVRRTEGRDQ
jgi:transcriptional regulator with XRE-family HTH domain